MTIKSQKLKWVEEVIYLGQLISFKDKTAKEVDRRIAIGWKKFWALKEIFNTKMDPLLKARVFNTHV